MTAEYIELSSDPKALLIRRMVYSVQAEMHRMNGFVRLSALGDKILFGYLKPRHEIGDRICDHFAMRSPGTMVVLGYHSKSWISLFLNGSMQKSTGPGLDATLDALRAIIGSSGCDGGIERLWEAYYSSQYCPERRNIQGFRRRMPKSSLDSAGDSLERNENGTTLNDFGMTLM